MAEHPRVDLFEGVPLHAQRHRGVKNSAPVSGEMNAPRLLFGNQRDRRQAYDYKHCAQQQGAQDREGMILVVHRLPRLIREL